MTPTLLAKYFRSNWPAVLDIICDKNGKDFQNIPETFANLRECLEYNVPHGKGLRGLATVYSFLQFSPNASKEEVKKACFLGWAFEMLQASLLVADDIMDSSLSRRGRPCWYLKPEVGLGAVNDAFMLEHAAYLVIRKVFGSEPYYGRLISMVQDVMFKTTLGQNLDGGTSKACKLEEYSASRYSSICEYKTSYYTTLLPVFGGLILSGRQLLPKEEEAVEGILLEIGRFFQIQDDFLDVFGDSETTGKIGSDIQEGKCSWLLVEALRKANDDEMAIIKNNVKQGPEGAKMVKMVFEDLNLPQEFQQVELEFACNIGDEITKTCDKLGLSRKPFTFFVKRLVNRKK